MSAAAISHFNASSASPREWQLWWNGAKDGEQLPLRFAVPASGRYAIEGTFARNRDYGDATFALRTLRARLSFTPTNLSGRRCRLVRLCWRRECMSLP